MGIQYKVDVMQELKIAGYSRTRLRKECILGEATMSKLNHCEPVSFGVLGKICKILKCQPGDILEYIDIDDSDISELETSELV